MRKKRILLTITTFFIAISFAQVGINTSNPQGIFNIDGGKNNPTTGAPSTVESDDDFTVKSNGNVGIGNANPQEKLEITSGVSNKSGLRFSNFNASTPASAGQTLGVDATGNVVTVPNATGTSVTTFEVQSSLGGAAFNVNDLSYTIVPSTSQSFTVPTGGKVLFMNFMLGIDMASNPLYSGYSYYMARIFVDGSATGTYLIIQEPGPGGLQMQYTLNRVHNLTAGNHTIDIRMIRSYNNGVASGVDMLCSPLSISFNASYLN